MDNLILTNIKTPDEIIFNTNQYNAKSPNDYFTYFQNVVGQYGIVILGFDMSDGWKGNYTKICFKYNDFIYNTFSINKFYRYCKSILETGFKPPRGTLSPELLDHRCNIISNRKSLEYRGYKIYNAARTKIILYCNHCDFEWETTVYDSFVNSDGGCPSCASYGFSQSKDGYFYIMKIHSDDNVLAYKMGITNNIEQRISQLKRSCTNTIDLFYVIKGSGIEIFNIESNLKKKITCNFLDENDISDGYTETFSPDLINNVFEYIKKGA